MTAKFSRGLIRRIYDYALEQGYLQEGQTVLDPFAGVALGGLDAMFHGLHWVGVELEEKFVSLGQGYDCDGKVASEPDGKLLGAKCGFMVDHDPHHIEGNIDLWNRRYGGGKLRRWGTARILQGDSRRLVEVLEGLPVGRQEARAEGIVASPPFSQPGCQPASGHGASCSHGDQGVRKEMEGIGVNPDGAADWAEGNLGNMPTGELPSAVISSPPYATKTVHGGQSLTDLTGSPGPHSQAFTMADYGRSDGQLAAMREGDAPQAVISSPPFADSQQGRRADFVLNSTKVNPMPRRLGDRSYFPAEMESEGQLAQMREGNVDAVIASPPHATSEVVQSHGRSWRVELGETEGSWRNVGSRYGDQDGQLAALPEGEPAAGIVSSFDNTTPSCYNQDGGDGNAQDSADSRALHREKGIHAGDSSPLAHVREHSQETIDRGQYSASKSVRSDEIVIQEGQGADPLLERQKGAQRGCDEKGSENQRPQSLQLEGRHRSQGIQEESPEGEVRRMRLPPESRDTSQRPRPLQRRPRQPASPLRVLPYEPTQETVVGSQESGQGTAEVKLPNGMGQVDGCISSPPWEKSSACEDPNYRTDRQASGGPLYNDYGDHPDQLGNQQGNTFWSAAKTILQQCHQVLAPGGVAIFVCKRFVRNKQIVEFSQQWADLCQSCGFELVEWIKAWLIEERGTQYDLEGKVHTKIVKRYSFFRRLHAQKYPHLAIEWEDVLIFRKGERC